jgi:hypothetical protein
MIGDAQRDADQPINFFARWARPDQGIRSGRSACFEELESHAGFL